MIITIFILLNALLLWKFLNFLLFKELRLIEQEHIMERLPFTIINFIFISTMFNEKFFITMAFYGFILLYMKIFYWILKDRLEFLIQSNTNYSVSRFIFSKFYLNLIILSTINLQLIKTCIPLNYEFLKKLYLNSTSILQSLINYSSPSSTHASNFNLGVNPIYLMLAMEFAILLINFINLFLHSILSLYEIYKSNQYDQLNAIIEDIEDENDDDDDTPADFNGLENKFIYEKIIDLFTRSLMTMIHISLALPLNLPMIVLKDIIWDLISLYQNCKILFQILKNNKNLDSKLPDMIPEDLQDSDNVCIVCMDDLLSEEHKKKKAKRLPCGHFLHLSCLKNWMERSQTCPICRLPVFDESGNVKESERPATAADADVDVDVAAAQPPSTSSSPSIPHSPIQETLEPEEASIDNNTWYSFPITHINKDKSVISFELRDDKESSETVQLIRETKTENVIIPDDHIHT